MWNYLNLKCPTEDLCEYDKQETIFLEKLPSLVKLLKTSSKRLAQDHPIWGEIEVFNNVQEQYKRILHSDRGVQLLQRVGTCIRKMRSLNLFETFLDLAKQFEVGLQSQSSPMLLPSCLQLEYVLIRTQSFAKLLCQALHYSKEAFSYIIQRLRLGQLVLNFTMATSVTARINILFRDNLVQIFDIYKKLYVWHEKLKKGTTKWPKPLDLPEDLEAWLNPEASVLLKSPEVSESQSAFLSHFFEEQKNGSNQTEDYNMDVQCEVGETSQVQLENIDVGEAIPRPKKIKKERTEIAIQLLDKIQKADSFKKLKAILTDPDVDSHALLKKHMSPSTKTFIKGILSKAKKKLVEIKNLDVPEDVKKGKKITIVQSTGKRLVKYLQLMETKSETNVASCTTVNPHPVVKSEAELKPAKTLKQFKLLYKNLNQLLNSKEQYEKCAILEKIFKNNKRQIRNLIINKRKKLARKVIIITSKEFLAFLKK